MSHMDRNSLQPNKYRVMGSNKSSMNYSIDSFRSSGALNSSFGLSGSACFAAQKEAVLQAERERIRLIREEQARNAEKQAALERTYADRQRSFIVDRIRKKQEQQNTTRKKAIQDLYWKSKSLGSVGTGQRNLDGASTTDSEDDEELRKQMMASLHSPGLQPTRYTSDDVDYDDDGDDCSSNASGLDYVDTRKVFRGSNGYNADQYEYDDDEDEEEYDEEEEDDDDDELGSEEEREMRKAMKYSMQSASPIYLHTPSFIQRILTDNFDIIEEEEELKNGFVSVKIADYQHQHQHKQIEEEKISPLRTRNTIQKSDVPNDSSSSSSASSVLKLQEQRIAAAACVKAEPSEKKGGTTQVVIRMPNGAKYSRRFLFSDSIKDLRNYIESKAEESGLGFDYEITRDFPKKTIHDQPIHTRLDSAGLSSRTLLHIKEI